MATEMKRLTFAVTKEMEALLNRAKKDIFYDKNQSDMIRELVMAGLNAMDKKEADKNKTGKSVCEKAPDSKTSLIPVKK